MHTTPPQFGQYGDPEGQILLDELVELRRGVAKVLGRRQYLYEILDRAVESHHKPTLQGALGEFERQPDEVKSEVLRAALRD